MIKNTEIKKVLICGAGSIGIFLGTKLNPKKYEVYLFGRRKLREAGKKVILENKEFSLLNRIFRLPKEESYDVIFLTCKLYDMNDIVNLLRKNKIKAEIISNVQNGLIDISRYERVLNKKILPICVFGGFSIDKNRLHSSPTSVGWLTINTPEGKKLSSIISENGVKCKPRKNFDIFRAEKMIVNCCLNALSAIENKPFNELFSDEETLMRIHKLFDETHAILSLEYPLKSREKLKEKMISDWSKVNHYSSTYQDVKSGRKTEIGFFNGFIVKKAKEHKIEAEENKKILKDFAKIR